MEDYLEALIAFGAVTITTTGLLALRTHLRYRPVQRDLTKQSSEIERLKNVLANTSTLESLCRVYQKDGQYQTAEGKTIEAYVVAQQVLGIDPAQSRRDQNYLINLLERVQESAQQAGARYFLLSEPVEINKYLAYSLALLRERKN